jgi:hypothetical protein
MQDFVCITQQLEDWDVRLISLVEKFDTGDVNPCAECQRGLPALLVQLQRQTTGRPGAVWRSRSVSH